jgi:anti-sigma B factor antagonist
MDIKVIERDGFIIAEANGDIDGKTAGIVQEQLLPLVNAGNCMLLDMSGVGYMSSAGLRLLLSLYRQAAARNAKLVLAGLSPEIIETMDVTGFISHFTIASSRADGEAFFTG